MINFKKNYNAGAELLDMLIAERLSGYMNPDSEWMECKKNRQEIISQAKEIYRSSNLLGKITYITGFCVRRMELYTITGL